MGSGTRLGDQHRPPNATARCATTPECRRSATPAVVSASLIGLAAAVVDVPDRHSDWGLAGSLDHALRVPRSQRTFMREGLHSARVNIPRWRGPRVQGFVPKAVAGLLTMDGAHQVLVHLVRGRAGERGRRPEACRPQRAGRPWPEESQIRYRHANARIVAGSGSSLSEGRRCSNALADLRSDQDHLGLRGRFTLLARTRTRNKSMRLLLLRQEMRTLVAALQRPTRDPP
jgi:hypothetical protein